MRRVATILSAVALVLAGFAPAQAHHVLTQDDAGSGSDAADADRLATPVEPGSYTGQLAAKADETDVYAIEVDSAEILRANFSSQLGLTVELVDPDGNVRDANSVFSASEDDLSSVARPTGTWLLRLQLDDATSLDTDVLYDFAIEVEHHENVRSLASPGGSAPAIHAEVTNTSFVRFELDPGAAGSASLDGEAVTSVFRLVFNRSAFQSTFAGIVGDVGNPQARVQGDLPADEHVQVRTPLSTGGWLLGTRVLETQNVSYTFSHGLAWSRGAQESGWLVWDGQEPNVTWRTGGQTAFHGADDMNATGRTVQAGPYIASEGLTAEETLPYGTNVVIANGETPDAAREPTRLVVTGPDNHTIEPGDEVAFRTGGFDPLPPGTWNATIEHVDGLEYDQVRFAAVSFPFVPFDEALGPPE